MSFNYKIYKEDFSPNFMLSSCFRLIVKFLAQHLSQIIYQKPLHRPFHSPKDLNTDQDIAGLTHFHFCPLFVTVFNLNITQAYIYG